MEEWKDIEGYGGIYQVSDLGKVRSYKNNRHGLSDTPKILTPTISAYGYHKVRLYRNGKSKQFNIHRLVASAFIENKSGAELVLHKNDVKSDNRTSNLYYGSHSDNMSDAIKNGIVSCDKRDSRNKLTEEDVIRIRRSDKNGYQLSKQYGVSPNTIYDVLKENSWTHV